MAQANIDYDVQGIRGGEPHHKNNVGNVTVEVDNASPYRLKHSHRRTETVNAWGKPKS